MMIVALIEQIEEMIIDGQDESSDLLYICHQLDARADNVKTARAQLEGAALNHATTMVVATGKPLTLEVSLQADDSHLECQAAVQTIRFSTSLLTYY